MKAKNIGIMIVVGGIWVCGFIAGRKTKTYEVKQARKKYDKATS